MTGQTVVITAFLLYFGRATVSATYAYFGLDSSLLSYSTLDYLVRLPNQAFLPLLATGLVSLVAILGVARLRRAVAADRTGTTARVPAILILVGAAVFVTGAALTFGVPRVGLYGPFRLFVVIGGAVVLGVGMWLRTGGGAVTSALVAAELAALGVVCLVALIGAWAIYAADVGTAAARELAGRLASRPAVTVYSKERLAVYGPGLTATALTGSPYVVKYGGLRLLTRTGDGTLYLLPKGWRHGLDPVYVLKPDAPVRLEIVATPD